MLGKRRGRRVGRRLARRYDATHVLWPRLSPVREGSWSLMSMVLEQSCPSIGILKVRETDGMAVRPDRSASRLLAASHISSLAISEGIQAKGLDMMRVR